MSKRASVQADRRSMLAEFETKRAALEALCRRLGARRLENSYLRKCIEAERRPLYAH